MGIRFHTPYGVTSFRTWRRKTLNIVPTTFPYALWRDFVSDKGDLEGQLRLSLPVFPYALWRDFVSDTILQERVTRTVPFTYALWRDFVSDRTTFAGRTPGSP